MNCATECFYLGNCKKGMKLICSKLDTELS